MPSLSSIPHPPPFRSSNLVATSSSSSAASPFFSSAIVATSSASVTDARDMASSCSPAVQEDQRHLIRELGFEQQQQQRWQQDDREERQKQQLQHQSPSASTERQQVKQGQSSQLQPQLQLQPQPQPQLQQQQQSENRQQAQSSNAPPSKRHSLHVNTHHHHRAHASKSEVGKTLHTALLPTTPFVEMLLPASSTAGAFRARSRTVGAGDGRAAAVVVPAIGAVGREGRTIEGGERDGSSKIEFDQGKRKRRMKGRRSESGERKWMEVRRMRAERMVVMDSLRQRLQVLSTNTTTASRHLHQLSTSLTFRHAQLTTTLTNLGTLATTIAAALTTFAHQTAAPTTLQAHLGVLLHSRTTTLAAHTTAVHTLDMRMRAAADRAHAIDARVTEVRQKVERAAKMVLLDARRRRRRIGWAGAMLGLLVLAGWWWAIMRAVAGEGSSAVRRADGGVRILPERTVLMGELQLQLQLQEASDGDGDGGGGGDGRNSEKDKAQGEKSRESDQREQEGEDDHEGKRNRHRKRESLVRKGTERATSDGDEAAESLPAAEMGATLLHRSLPLERPDRLRIFDEL